MVRAHKLEQGDIVSITVGKDINIVKDYKKIKLGSYLVSNNGEHTFKNTIFILEEYDVILKVIEIIKNKLFKRIINWLLRKNNYTTLKLEVIKSI